MDDKADKVALFRYGLIAPLVLETLPRGELTRRAQEIAARLYDILSGVNYFSLSTTIIFPYRRQLPSWQRSAGSLHWC